MPTSLQYQLVGVNMEIFCNCDGALPQNCRYVQQDESVYKVDLFRFEIAGILLTPLATAIVVAILEGLRRLGRRVEPAATSKVIRPISKGATKESNVPSVPRFQV